MKGSGVWRAGVDGCRAGWIAVGLGPDQSDETGWEVAVVPALADLLERWTGLEYLMVDIPIGLPPCGTVARECDREARARLGRPRGSSVFPAPSRSALAARTHAEASDLNRSCLGKGLSIQAWNLVPRIAEVDSLLGGRPGLMERVLEAHPEVIFRQLAGGHPMEHSKASAEGRAERRSLLRQALPQTDQIEDRALEDWTRAEVARDDILDALACAVTALLAPDGIERLPADPPVDAEGRPMQIVCPRIVDAVRDPFPNGAMQ